MNDSSISDNVLWAVSGKNKYAIVRLANMHAQNNPNDPDGEASIVYENEAATTVLKKKLLIVVKPTAFPRSLKGNL